MCIEFKQQVVECGSGIFCSDASLTCVPQLCQGCHGEAPRLSKDFLGKAKKTSVIIRLKKANYKGRLFYTCWPFFLQWNDWIGHRQRCDTSLLFYLHESVAVVNKWAAGDLLEDLADVWQRLGLSDQSLVVVDQSQSYAEQDFRALVEQAIPNPQNCLRKNDKDINPASYFNELLYF